MQSDIQEADGAGCERLFSVKLRHIGTGIRWVVPVRAATAEEARVKASDWPYANDGYAVDSLEDTGPA